MISYTYEATFCRTTPAQSKIDSSVFWTDIAGLCIHTPSLVARVTAVQVILLQPDTLTSPSEPAGLRQIAAASTPKATIIIQSISTVTLQRLQYSFLSVLF